MITDNFDRVIKFMEFSNPDDFYFLQIIQRKKDGNETGRGNNGARLIKAYYIRSTQHLLEKKNKIIELCKNNNARAYITVNKRSFSRYPVDVNKFLQNLLWKAIHIKPQEYGIMYVENFQLYLERIYIDL